MGNNQAEILIVDDEQSTLPLLERVLALNEFTVRPTTSGQAALQTAQAQPPDLILLDISMPVMDGFETCRRPERSVPLKACLCSTASEAERRWTSPVFTELSQR